MNGERRGLRRDVAGLLLLTATVAACGAEYGAIEEMREGIDPIAEARVGETAAERLFGAGGGATARPENPLTWDVPEGWREVTPRSRFRAADFEVAGDPLTECYLSLLPPGAGGVVANVNRWASQQMGLPEFTSDQVAALPRLPLLGAPAVYVSLDGTFTGGMGGTAIDDARMLGLVLELPELTLFVKCVGPRATVEGAEQQFAQFAASIRMRSSLGAEGGSAAQAVPQGPPTGPPAGPPAPADGGVATSGTLRTDQPLPRGWQFGDERPMRLMTVVTPAGEISVSRATGGLALNVARWYRQMGQDAPDPSVLEALPTVPMLGADAALVDILGSFSGMGNADLDEARMLGLVCPLGDDQLFVKLVGPPDAVAAERFRMIAFAQSLRFE